MRPTRSMTIAATCTIPLLAGLMTAGTATAQPALPSPVGSVAGVLGPLPAPPVQQVDPGAYAQGENYFFQSADKTIKCGIITTGPGAPKVGCQGSVPPNPPLPNCPGNGELAPGVSIEAGSPARYECYNQGVFVGAPTDGTNQGGGNVLGPLARITVGDISCTSAGVAISCRNGGADFTASGLGFAWT